jgi:hypothetical protein
VSVSTAGPGAVAPPGATGAGDVERAVRVLNEIYLHGAIGTALALGKYVLDVFLGGDVGRLALGNQDPWLRELSEHPGLDVPASSLWVALRVFHQYLGLPEPARDRLPLAHHRLLLGVTTESAKARLATEAVARDWTMSALEEAVNRWRSSQHLPPLGGVPLHPALEAARRGATAILRAAQALESGPPPSRAERDEIEHQVVLVRKRLERLLAALAAARARPRRRR